jgi:perosamine synthetase
LDEKTAILVVHNIGNIVNVPKLQRRFPETIILEDNCEGFLGEYENFKTGTKSFAASVSFFGNKTITSGEGGAFITNDDEVFNYINVVKNQGQSDVKFIHETLGYNYRMTNLQAAILFGQLQDLEKISSMKQTIFDNYRKNFEDIDEITTQKIESETKHSNWMFGVRFPNFSLTDKKNLELYLFESGVDTRPMFFPIDRHKYLNNLNCQTTNSKLLNEQCLILPSFPELTESQITYISNKIKKFLVTK